MHERELFIAALQLEDTGARQAYLNEVCASDPALHRRVNALMEAHRKAEGFIEKPAIDAGETVDRAPLENAGTRIGPYKLLQQIGEGGMGAVWMAEQHEPVRRKVALKLIKPGMDTRQVIARFEAERQALAMMDHPHIARVLEAGTTEAGRPYFVMELVKGIPITRYCNDNGLTARQRLELFIPICHAVQHAHQKGVVHRDIKPSNILVAEYDGRPVAKIIDFGVAKAIGPELTEKTNFTAFGQILGTIEYMSPEQARLNQLDIDTRTDIYSLGVVLYELLSGETPFDRRRLKTAAFDEMLRIIREEEPPKPSTRLKKTPTSASPGKSHDPERLKLSRMVRGELDWIVMKALEKDRSRRYETAHAMGLDIERYLTGRVVTACPPSARYRLGKFVRRNRLLITTITAMLLALSLGFAHSEWQRSETRKQLYRAQIMSAWDMFHAGNPREARRIVEYHRSRRDRGIEWFALAHELEDIGEPWAQVADISPRNMEVSADGSMVAVQNAAEGLVVYDRNGTLVTTIDKLARYFWPINPIGLSPDGRMLAYLKDNVELRLRDIRSNRDWEIDIGDVHPVSVAFSPQVTESRLAVADAEGDVLIVDWEKEKIIRRLSFSSARHEHPERIRELTLPRVMPLQQGANIIRLRFSTDGSRLATASQDGWLVLWQYDTGAIINAWEHDNELIGVDFSPDGTMLAVCYHHLPNEILLWNTMSGDCLGALSGHTRQVRAVRFLPDGRLASAASDNTIRIWDVRSRLTQRILRGHSKTIVDLAGPNGDSVLYSTSRDGEIWRWELSSDPNVREWRAKHNTQVSNLAVSADGRRLISTQVWLREVELWDTATGRRLEGV